MWEGIMSQIPQLDLATPQFKSNPYPYYARLREEAPVFRTTVHFPSRGSAWLVTRYDDVAAVLKDSRFAKDPLRGGANVGQPWIPGLLRPMTRNMLDLDAPDHTRLRALVQKAFTPRLIEQLCGRIGELCERFLAPSVASGRMELIAQYALPLPITIIADLLGIPNQDRRRFHAWSARLVAVSRPRDAVLVLPAAWMFLRYVRRLVEYRRARPGDDLLSALIQAEEAGDRLSADELLAMVVLLLIAGHETTVNLIASGTLALLECPDQLARLRADPALAPTAVEELVRFVAPVEIATERYASHDLELRGQPIPRGGLVLAVLASANRDARRFERPNELDLGRSPNPHLSFGQGAHYCLGAPLARLEGQIAFNTLLHRMPRLRLAVPSTRLRWRRGLFVRGLERLPVVNLPEPDRARGGAAEHEDEARLSGATAGV
jgi:cytochrome P450 PksS